MLFSINAFLKDSAMKRAIQFACAAILLGCFVSAPVLIVKQLLATGVDDQYVILKGKLIRHSGGKHYDFADQGGEIRIEIDPEHFPPGVTIDANTAVELLGKYDKERFGKSEVEVKQIRLATK
ncbi:MAG: NirD/YgiW/YdeI family stress tolerance protein [Massilia sp.]|nr:NirD/YgiW/YdeI family stress tolerance protein [Massilia sp.]